jgi:hypothetical protein
MTTYKIINVGFPSTKMGLNKKINEWENVCNKMAQDGWKLNSTINQGTVCALIFEHD